MTDRASGDEAMDWLEAELADSLDEDYELELSDAELSLEIRRIYRKTRPTTMERLEYFRNLLTLQAELIKLQDWVIFTGAKVVVLFEGRDAAGKGGVIKRIAQRLNPRVCRVVALPAPTEREKSEWYFQRYVRHLPAAGEIVLFDRSWYNRAGVERVMGFASAEQVEKFFNDVPEFERTSIPEAPWSIVEGNDKKRARLNCIAHFLEQIPYEPVPNQEITLPNRVFNPEYDRRTLPRELYVPQKY